MILVDTSVWIDHLRDGVSALERLLTGGAVLGHPWVVGELPLGQLASARRSSLSWRACRWPTSSRQPRSCSSSNADQLIGLGIGYVDIQLLAATQVTPDAMLWATDKRLGAAAARLGLAIDPKALNSEPSSPER